MGKITLTSGQNFQAYALHIGALDTVMVSFDEATLEVEVDSVDQATMDAGLISYAADQANLDDVLNDYLEDQEGEFGKNEFKDNKGLTAVIKEMVDELNAIRQNAGLPDLNFGLVNAAIRQRINKP